MKYSLNWINEFTPWKGQVPLQKLLDRVTTGVNEIESAVDWSARWDHFAVGIVRGLQPHPDAAKLRLVEVDLGSRMETFVCGGTNLEPGQPVAIALPGAKVRWHGEGEEIILAPAKIRGIESRGMICAAEEFGIAELFPSLASKAEGEVVDLRLLDAGVSWEAAAGQPLAQALAADDVVIEIDNKAINHRPDLWGHYGFAREIAALFELDLLPYHAPEGAFKDAEPLHVTVSNAIDCPYFRAAKFESVSGAALPLAMRSRLHLCGMRAVHPLADLANYVMLEFGQPLHSYDAEKISGRLGARRGDGTERLTLLDGRSVVASADDVVIADEKGPVALAGVMGGADSAVSANTSSIILEAANFLPWRIRATAAAHGARSDASSRFEKHVDPLAAEIAAARFAFLLSRVAPAARVTAAGRVGDALAANPPLDLTVSSEWLEKKIGMAVPAERVAGIMRRLGFGAELLAGGVKLSVPSWRRHKDVRAKEDVIEEVLRIHGYNHIPLHLPVGAMRQAANDPFVGFVEKARDFFVRDAHAVELQTYSFVRKEWLAEFGFHEEDWWHVSNPLRQGEDVLRPHLLPTMAAAGFKPGQAVFEIGRVFREPQKIAQSADAVPEQPYQLVCVIVQDKREHAWPDGAFHRAQSLAARFFESIERGATWQALDRLHLWQHVGQHAAAYSSGQAWREMGYVAGLHPKLKSSLKLDGYDVAVLVLDLESCYDAPTKEFAYRAVGQFPAAKRDVSVVVPSGVTVQEVGDALHDAIRSDAYETTRALFDVYRGGAVGEGMASQSWHLEFSSRERTLSAAEADAALARAKEAFSAKGWQIR